MNTKQLNRQCETSKQVSDWNNTVPVGVEVQCWDLGTDRRKAPQSTAVTVGPAFSGMGGDAEVLIKVPTGHTVFYPLSHLRVRI